MPEKKQKEYLVIWEMEIPADNPMEAAERALEIHRDPESIATVFDIYESGKRVGYRIDLLDPDEKPVKIKRL